jgi:hypothetical protein
MTTSVAETISGISAEPNRLLVEEPKPSFNRRWSMKSLTSGRANAKLESSQAPKRTGTLHSVQEEEKKQNAAAALVKRASKTSASDRKAKEYACVVRSLIVGTTLSDGPKPNPVGKTQINKVKGELLEPKTANKLIAQLRALPVAEVPISSSDNSTATKIGTATKGHGPIHAVCLPFTESEAMDKHFSRVQDSVTNAEGVAQLAIGNIPSVATATLETAVTMFQDLHIVDLLAAPNMGIGAPGDAPGLLSGAVPVWYMIWYDDHCTDLQCYYRRQRQLSTASHKSRLSLWTLATPWAKLYM